LLQQDFLKTLTKSDHVFDHRKNSENPCAAMPQFLVDLIDESPAFFVSVGFTSTFFGNGFVPL